MATIFKKEHKTDRPVVLFIADGLAEQCEMIRQALVKAQTALQIGDVFLLDPGDLPLLQHKIRDMLKGNKIDLIIAPRRIYDILRRLGLAHLFVDLHSLLFDGESKPEVFYAEPGIYGIAGTGNPGRFDLVVPPDVIEKLKERPRNVEDLLKDKGVPGPGGGPVHPQAPCDIGSQDPWGAKFKFGPGSASCELRRSFGMQDPPAFNPGSHVADGSESNTDDSESGTNQYGGTTEKTIEILEGGHTIETTTQYDDNGTVRQTNSQEIIPGSDGDCWIFDSTQHYDDQGRKGDEEITVTPCNVVTIPPVEKNDQLDILGPDPYMAMKEFFDQLMLDKWLKKKMLGMLPGDTGTKEWSKGSLKLGVGDMLLLKAKYGEKDDTGRFVMRWVTGDGKALHTNEVWEQHWKETGYIDPMPSLVYEGRVEAIGGKCDLENRAIDLDIHTKAKKKNKNQ